MLDTGLRHRVCLVTGAAKGIGLACAQILADQGAALALCDRDAAGLRAIRFDGLRVQADVGRRPEVERVFAEIDRELGRLDVLIHCAGIYRITKLPEVGDAASKAGVEGVTRHVAAYAGPLGVRVNCLHPGFTETPMNDVLDRDAPEEAANRTPLRRRSEAHEQATMAVVLASDLASFVHGVTLDVNGGMYMA